MQVPNRWQVLRLYRACLRSAKRCPELHHRQTMWQYVQMGFRDNRMLDERNARLKLTAAEQARWDEHQADMELVEQFERKPLKSVQCGLGATFYEYNELAVQFGYITMFSVVLPLGALFALANNFLEIRLDAAKVLESTRRVKPSLTDGIGAWAGVING